MIVQDIVELKKVCRETTVEECRNLGIFSKLESELGDTGLGLAANQIGFDIRALIIRLPKLKLNLMNPVIEEFDIPLIYPNEGCLSFPGIRLHTNRFKQVTASWVDSNSGEVKRGVFYGEEAIVLQHEVDHLNGLTIHDREVKTVSKVGRNEPCPCGSGKKYKKCCGK